MTNNQAVNSSSSQGESIGNAKESWAERLLALIAAPVIKNSSFFFFMYVLSLVAAACTVVVSAKAKLYDKAWAEILFVLYGVCVVLALLPKVVRRVVRAIIYVIAYAVSIVDVACYVRFDSPLTPSMLMLAGETDSREAGEFFATYLSPDIILTNVGFVLLVMAIHIAWTLHRWLRRPVALCEWEDRFRHSWSTAKPALGVITAVAVTACGVASWQNVSGFCDLMQIQNIGDVEHRLTEKDSPKQFLPLQRLAFSIRANQLTAKQIQVLHRVADTVRVDSCSYTSPNIVLIIGEAYNRRHSELYGYDRPTTPRQLEMQKKGDLVAYQDVVSPWNLTSYVFKHFMSTYVVGDRGEWCDYPLFGEIFRKAGYHVTFLTNEFLTQPKQAVYDFSGGFFINDPLLSKAQFDVRNTKLHVFDEGLLHDYMGIRKERELNGDTLQKGNLTIFHLIGQHQNYRIRCPQSKMHFTLDDYADRTDLKKEIWKKNLCWYDNATLYNDSIVSEIVGLFKDKDAIVIYMPDHGEEVHSRELPHFSGRMHSTEIVPRLAREEFDIPFWFCATPTYQQRHPQLWAEIKAAANRPYMTDALPHLLMYLAGIHCQYYREEFNILSPQYNAKRPRILKHQADYDKIVNK